MKVFHPPQVNSILAPIFPTLFNRATSHPLPFILIHISKASPASCLDFLMTPSRLVTAVIFLVCGFALVIPQL